MTSSSGGAYSDFQFTWTTRTPPTDQEKFAYLKTATGPGRELAAFVIARLDEEHAAVKRRACLPCADPALRAIAADRAIVLRCAQAILTADSLDDAAMAEHILMDMAGRWPEHAHYEAAWTL